MTALEIINRQSSITNSRPAPALLLAAVSLLFASSCSRRPAPPQPYLAFVVSSETRSVVTIDLAYFRTVASIALAAPSERAVVRPRSRQVWVVSSAGLISIIGFPELRVVQAEQLAAGARDLIFSADGSQAFLLNPDEGEIVFVDAGSMKVNCRVRAGPALSSLALSPDGRTLVAASTATNRLYFVSTVSRALLGSVEVGREPGAIVILPDSSKVLVADRSEQKITAADLSSRQVLSHIEIGARPGSLLLKPDGGELFVLCPQASTLCIVDAFHDNVSQNVPTGRGPAAAVIRRDSSVLYVANAGDGSVTTLDVQNRLVLASTQVGKEPRALALTPDERFLVVADTATSSLAVLIAEPERLAKVRSALVTTIPAGSGPIDVVVPDWLWK